MEKSINKKNQQDRAFSFVKFFLLIHPWVVWWYGFFKKE